MAPDVTALLHAWRGGDRDALEQLMPTVYAELHRLADRQLRGERAGHTFRPTDLISEAYLRLTSSATPAWNDRNHFYAVAARCMRQILIDYARRRTAAKRGAAERAQRVELDEIGVSDRSDEMLALGEALAQLAEHDERKAKIIELYYFGGLTHEEIASLLELHVNTVARDARLAAAWLHRMLQSPP